MHRKFKIGERMQPKYSVYKNFKVFYTSTRQTKRRDITGNMVAVG